MERLLYPEPLRGRNMPCGTVPTAMLGSSSDKLPSGYSRMAGSDKLRTEMSAFMRTPAMQTGT